MINIVDDLNREIIYSDYEKIRDRFVKICEECGVSKENIAFFGTIGHPGISDLDAVVVSSPDLLKKIDVAFNYERSQSSVFSYIFWHPPVYVINKTINYLRHLHTLENLTPLIENSIFKSEVSISFGNDKKVLNIVWFCFLTNVYLDIYKRVLKGNAVNLRLLLLVYNNIMHSYLFFSKEEMPKDIISSNKLRAIILNGGDTGNNGFLWGKLSSLFLLAINQFDSFCNESVHQIKNFPNLGQTLIFPKYILRLSPYTEISFKKKIIVLDVNHLYFTLAKSFLFNKSFSKPFERYIHSSILCMEEYKLVGIKYPFVRPIPIPGTKFKKFLLTSINKFCTKLTQ